MKDFHWDFYFAIPLTNSFPYRKYDQFEKTPRKSLEVGQSSPKAKGVAILNDQLTKTLTPSSLDMAYSLRNYFI